MTSKKEYGDFQTPDSLATRVTALVDELYGPPDVVVEPTVGLGAFMEASAVRWGKAVEYVGYDVNKNYADLARERLKSFGAQIFERDFFLEDWRRNLSRPAKCRTLVLGNPPWVTNSDLGQLGSTNLPQKSNFQDLRGFDARTGKSNFDIAEWMLIRLIEALPPDGAIAMLCKTMTARKVLRHLWKTVGGRVGSRLFHIDARAEFDVAVDACLFFATGTPTTDCSAVVYADLSTSSASTKFGLVDGELVADVDAYTSHRSVELEPSAYTWRSGVKHDAAKVMEFTRHGRKLINGFGDEVKIENDYVFPLLKSSDLGNGRIHIRKAVLVTQRHTGDDTQAIQEKAPRTWAYLMRYKDILDGRKSSIYNKRPRFCVFGIGEYSFAPWKVGISGLYKNMTFVVVPPCDERPVMLDDTCYSIPCHSESEAEFLLALLSSTRATTLLKSLVFTDSKRPITIDVLRRLSIVDFARQSGRLDEFIQFVQSGSASQDRQLRSPLLTESA